VFKNDAGVLTEKDCAVDNIVRYRIVDKPNEISSLGLESKQQVRVIVLKSSISTKVMQKLFNGQMVHTALPLVMSYLI
jgi:hypothetical protein